ncbi:MAG: hypothetical protein NTX50_27945 [Candidatus Sumerlaeota bacterium]|nr:hypothetical protein [Candidatus Sumerlaeota bacterium]
MIQRVPSDGDYTYPLDILYTISGAAIPGSDYVTIPPSPITIAANQDTVLIDVTPIQDLTFTGLRSVVITLTDTPYYVSTPNNLTINISDMASPTPGPTPSPTPSLTPKPTPSPSPTPSPFPTPSITPKATQSPTPSITPGATPSATPFPTITPGATPRATFPPTPQPTPVITEPPAPGMPLVADMGIQYGEKYFKEGYGPGIAWAAGYYMMTAQEGKVRGWTSIPGNASQQISPYFLQDHGASNFFSNAAEMLRGTGGCTMALYPRANSPLTPRVYQDASQYKITGYYSLFQHQPSLDRLGRFASRFNNDLNKIKSILDQGGYVVLGIPVFDSFIALDHKTNTYNRRDTIDSHRGYHAVCVVKYDDRRYYELSSQRGAFRVINAWGTKWGQAGYAWLGYDFVTRYALEAWAMNNDGPLATVSPMVVKGLAKTVETQDYVVRFNGVGDLSVTSSGIFVDRGGFYFSSTLSIVKKKNVVSGRTLSIVRTDGSFKQVFTQGPIGRLECLQLKSLTAVGVAVADIRAAEIGKIRMSPNPNSTWPDLMAAYPTNTKAIKKPSYTFINIFGNSSLPFTYIPVSADVNITGGWLRSFVAPYQTAKITVSTKKNQIRGTGAFMSYAAMGFDQTTDLFAANEFKSLSVKGGVFQPLSCMDFNRAGKASVLQTRSQTFMTSRKWIFGRFSAVSAFSADIQPGLVYSAAGQMSIKAAGGNIAAQRILGAGQLLDIFAGLAKYRLPDRSPRYLGGFVSNPATTLTVVSAATMPSEAPSPIVNINSIHGDCGIFGDFYAGAALSTNTLSSSITATRLGEIKLFSTKGPSSPFSLTYINGRAFVRPGTTPLFKGPFANEIKLEVAP